MLDAADDDVLVVELDFELELEPLIFDELISFTRYGFSRTFFPST